MRSLLSLFASLALFRCQVESFGLAPSSKLRFGLRLFSTTTSNAVIADKFYQLEELEDKETCTTEIFLNPDMTVTVGKTDGPVFLSASGTWEQSNDGSFKMRLSRKYEAGREKTNPTDMGEFEFQVERTFTGELSQVGNLLAVTGAMHQVDDLGDRKVGFFNMLDTTKERLGEEDEEEK